jgi:hypothetical protein
MNIKKVIDKVSHEVETLKGDQTKDLIYSSEHVYSNERTAAHAFLRAKAKLFAVNDWSTMPSPTSTFELFDSHGRPRHSDKLLVDDYIRIELPLPGNIPANWVQVTDIQVTETEAEFTVVPSADPQRDQTDESAPIEHFFGPEASSTFRVERRSNRLIACEIGRNERVNNQGEAAGNRGTLNTLIAAGGWAFFQEVQWKKLTEYLVHL